MSLSKHPKPTITKLVESSAQISGEGTRGGDGENISKENGPTEEKNLENITWHVAVDIEGTEVSYGEELKLKQVFDADELRILRRNAGFAKVIDKFFSDEDDDESDTETLHGEIETEEDEEIENERSEEESAIDLTGTDSYKVIKELSPK